jgi:hypothetical protein
MTRNVTKNEFIGEMRKGDNVIFKDCNFTEGISFLLYQGAIRQNFSFDNCIFKEILFQQTHFNGKISFQSCFVEESVSINACSFKKDFKAYHLSCPRIAIWNTNFYDGFNLYNFDRVENLTLQFNDISGRVSVKQWHVDPVILENIHITFEKFQDGNICFEDFVSRKIEIQFPGQHLQNNVTIAGLTSEEFKVINLGNKANNKVWIKRITSNSIHFLWLHNDGLLSLQDIQAKEISESTSFNISESYFGNAELYHINLKSFRKIQIFNCHLQNIIPVNVKWNFNESAYEGIKPDYLREFFRQLKNICAKNMDKVSQLRFEKMEMDAYTLQLNPKTDFQDWIILKSNELSNSHGQSWAKPLLWLLLFSFVLYTLLQVVFGSFGEYHLGNYFNFLLPFHDVKDVLVINGTGGVPNLLRLIDVLQKLISGYFIFQFLRAFRKYVN